MPRRRVNELGGLVLTTATLCACGRAHDEKPRAPQHEITAAGELLTADGKLREAGWSKKQLLRWDAAKVRDPKRLRQWDFFTVMSEQAAVNLTITDLGFVQVCSVSVVDFANNKKTEASILKGFPRDVFSLSDAVEGKAEFHKQDAPTKAMTFVTTSDKSEVVIDIPASPLGEAAKGQFTLTRRPSMPYLSLATPFDDDPALFFFEQKIPGMSAEGTVTIAGRTHSFSATNAHAVMDWGRGAWPSHVVWRWAGASGTVGGKPLAFNLGNGFGNATAATENLVVHDDVAHKLAEIDWTYDHDDPMREWSFRAPDGRAQLTLTAIAQEIGGIDFGSKYSRLRKAYGRFRGTLTLDGGRVVSVDGMLGFAEEMEIEW